MKTRKIILLSAIVLLCGVYMLQIVFGGRDSVKILKLADKIDTIVIAAGPNALPLTISKDDDKWILGDKKYPADSSLVEVMVTALAEIKTLGTVSGSGDYARYGLDEGARLTVTASKGGKVLRTVVVGKNATTAQQCYVLLDGGKSVQLVSGNFKETFGKDLTTLRNRLIWSISADGITRVDVASSGTPFFALAKAGTPAAWVVATPDSAKNFALDANKASSWALLFASVTADSFAPEGTAIPAKPFETFTITGGGKTITFILLAKEGDARYLCSSSENPYPFYLSAAIGEKFVKSYRDFGKTVK